MLGNTRILFNFAMQNLNNKTMATTIKQTTSRKRTEEKVYEGPKRLSKAGEWKRKNPNGILTILDMKAVMK